MTPSTLRSGVLAASLLAGACSTEPGAAKPTGTTAASGGTAGRATGGSAGAATAAGGSGGSAAGSAGATSGGSGGTNSAGSDPGPGLGAAEFASGELDALSPGGTITLQQIGATGWYPSRREPTSGQCDAYANGDCCMTKHELTSDELSPWNEELIMTLRGPLVLKQFVAYQPDPNDSAHWAQVSAWDSRSPGATQGIAFKGNGSEAGFDGVVGSECLVDASPDRVFACGSGSVPYCPAAGDTKYYGWDGPKLLVLLASMPRVSSGKIDQAEHCADGTAGNWYDAPWLGLSHGELIRSGAFGGCHCYAKNPDEWWLADGCGQFNVFEVVNDNNEFANFDLFSTNLFAYHGYVGEGPCGTQCDLSSTGPADLIDKSTSAAAAHGAICTPDMGPGAAFRRPSEGYRYFVMLLDVKSRTIQLAVIHPQSVPAALSGLLPSLPFELAEATIDGLRELRLPAP